MEVAFADGGVEGGATEVADVVAQHAVLHRAGEAMVPAAAEGDTFQGVAVVGRIGFVPVGIAHDVGRAPKVDVSIAQLVAHVAQNLEEGAAREGVVDLGGIAIVDLVPVQAIFFLFVVEEAIMFVDDVPKCLKITATRGAVILGGDAGRERHPRQENPQEKGGEAFHRSRNLSVRV